MRKIISVILCISMIWILAGCSAEKLNTEKLRDITFTVVPEDDIPDELEEMIEDKEGEMFKLTFADNGNLYIAIGYGKQKTSGYSIEVKELYETKNAVVIHTNLIGPSNDEKIVARETEPYIVVKMEFVDKNVVFE